MTTLVQADTATGRATGRGAGRAPREPLPLQRYRLFESRDVDETRDFVARVFCPHRLIPLDGERSLDACHHSALLHRDASLNYVQYGAAVRIEPGFLGDFYLLQIPLRGRASVRCGRQRVESHPRLASLPSPTESLSMHWGADSPQLILKMDREALQRRLEGLLQDRLREPLVFELGADLGAPSAQGVVGFIAYLRALLDGDGRSGPPAAGPVAELAENHLLTSVLLSLRHNHSDRLAADRRADPSTATAAPLPRVVRRAQAYMQAQLEAPITLVDVCEQVGVSARSLQVAFARHHQVGPMEYLRNLRLDRVQQVLRASGEQPPERAVKVQEVAARHGFLHLGHFAARYRERFGEAPSETLRRAVAG